MTTRFADHLLDGTHAARPAATAVPAGTLYAAPTTRSSTSRTGPPGPPGPPSDRTQPAARRKVTCTS